MIRSVNRFFVLALGIVLASAGSLAPVKAQSRSASQPADELPSSALRSSASILAHANAALQAGKADKALSLLQQLPDGGARDAQAQNLACRVEFTVAQWDAAIRDCQQAIRLDPRNSDNHMWLGRALGEKANQASFLSAFQLGKRVLAEFQTATQLDPRNAPALSDLGEFYLEAPGVLGGGLQKAESIAEQLDRVDPARAAELRAGMASQRGDYAQAEAYLKKALAVRSHPARQWSALARFYAARGRWNEMETAVQNCESAAAHDPGAAVALYDAASVLIKVKRDPQLAEKLLQEYLASPYKTEEAPAFIAYARLARLQQNLGEDANAQVALAAASELASEYQPLRDFRR